MIAEEPIAASSSGDAVRIYTRGWLRGLRADPRISVSEWAESYRILSAIGSSEQGPYRVARTPYWREPMNDLSASSRVERVTIMKGAQLGATELANNWVAYVIDVTPGPMLMVAPSEGLAKKISRQRLDPMFRDCPRLRGKVRATKAREAESSLLLKSFPGGLLSLVGANAASGFRSMPARYLACDEVDDYPLDVEEEGDPLLLAERATTTFRTSRKILAISTPTVSGRSRIETEFERGDRRYYHVPCPHCGMRQRLVWPSVVFDDDLDPDEAGAGARYRCAECAVLIEEREKPAMLSAGEWVAEEPSRSAFHRSYHLSALYSPWRRWGDIVARFLRAKGKPSELRTFVNHDLGETWKDKGEAPEWEVIYRRREPYAIGVVPRGGLVLTAGVDVQGDRIELEVVAWGAPRPGEALGESWSVEYLVLPGEVDKAEVWNDLSDVLRRRWPHESGATLGIARAAVDSSAYSQTVYRWGRRQSVRQVMVAKGVSSSSVVLGQPQAVDVQMRGKRVRRGVKLWTIGVGLLKEDLYGRLRIEPPLERDEPYLGGYCHVPEYPEEWFRQLVAEQLVARVVRGYRVFQWEKTRDRNEALDCRVYAMAAAESLGLPRWTPDRWLEAAREVGGSIELPDSTAVAPKRHKRRKGGGIDRWRRRGP